MTGGGRPLVVLQSFPEPRPTTNPYLVMLRDALEATGEVRVLTFSWRTALTGSYDLFHMHWPEILVRGRTPGRALARQVLTALFVLRLRARGTPVVRTVHNVGAHEGLSRRQAALLGGLDRRTVLDVLINDSSNGTPGRPTALVPHGHYRGWFAARAVPATVSGRFAFAGLVKPYKNVDGLVRAFRATTDPALTLSVGGSPSPRSAGDPVRAAATGDPRVQLRLEFLPDADLVDAIGRAELVVLPYREVHNSGAVLAALSLDRPVLVPDNPVTSALAQEVGAGWVLTHPGELTAGDLTAALHTVRGREPGSRPDLSARGWDHAGGAHLAAYRRAVGLRPTSSGGGRHVDPATSPADATRAAPPRAS